MLLLVAYAMIGIIIVISVATRRRLFWPLLLFATVGAADLVVGPFRIVEQVLTFSVIYGAILSILIRKASPQDAKE